MDPRDIESRLRKIKTETAKAISEATGAVENQAVAEQTQALKKWIEDFEILYVARAKDKPHKSNEISAKGREMVGEAWHIYEVMLSLGWQAGEPPAPVKYATLPSGVVSAETKMAALNGLRDLLRDCTEFRTKVLGE